MARSSKKSRKGRQKKSLSHGRPPTAPTRSPSLSRNARRKIIHTYHLLQKDLTEALKTSDESKIEALEKQIDANGGLTAYQHASIIGQAADRGGDTSKQLMEWLQKGDIVPVSAMRHLSMLEVGALSPNNACAKAGLQMTRIDLKSNHRDIEEQDFMERPIPTSDSDRFDIISLSLVLNYVPEPDARGEMLRRTCSFVKRSTVDARSGERPLTIPPALFLVLPKSCVTNSRYLTEKHLGTIMAGLGFRQAQRKLSNKLYYSLWEFNPEPEWKSHKVPKTQVYPGMDRNNFCIVLR